jgi:hypothetical protein
MVWRRERDSGVDIIWENADEQDRASDRSAGGAARAQGLGAFGILVVAVLLTGWLVANRDQDARLRPEESTSITGPASQELEFGRLDDRAHREALRSAGSLPAPLVAAELYRAAPGPQTARSLLASIGGVEGLILGSADGAFDVVTFDPEDPAHLLASRRSSYGPAENQAANEEWFVSGGTVVQTLFDPDRAHDVAHFNDDGSLAVWTNSGNTGAFASRTVAVHAGLDVVSFGPVYASRSVIVDGTLFALTGSEDYYATDRRFESLIADRGGRQTELDSGRSWSWIDSPAPGVVVAYPAGDQAVTRAWDTSSLREIVDHPLAGHHHQRVAVSGDGRTAVAATNDHELEVIDLTTGTIAGGFGELNPEGIAEPITLNADGTIAITVDWNGTVTLWWVGHEQPLAVIDGDAGPSRHVAEHRAPRTSSAVEPSGQRIALRRPARSETPLSWQIIDTDLDSWVERACDLAGRALTMAERSNLGLAAKPPACA